MSSDAMISMTLIATQRGMVISAFNISNNNKQPWTRACIKQMTDAAHQINTHKNMNVGRQELYKLNGYKP